MKIIVITQHEDTDNEHDVIREMFEEGLTTLHIRKPKYSRSRMESFIQAIPKKYHSRVVLHSHHGLALKYRLKGIHIKEQKRKSVLQFLKSYFLISKIARPHMTVSTSVHKLKTLKKMRKRAYSYVFLSPVFKSLSKEDYRPSFALSDVQTVLSDCKVKTYALGGIEASNILTCLDLGFTGVAVLGFIWNDQDPVKQYKMVKELCSETVLC